MDVLELIISLLCAAGSFAGGWIYTLRLFKKKEVKLSETIKRVLMAASAVIFAGVAIAFTLLIPREYMTYFEVLRSEILIFILLFTAIIDFKLMIIPNALVLTILGAAVAIYAVEAAVSLQRFPAVGINALLGMSICFIIFLIGKMISHKGMGMGDIKLAAVMGLTLGMDYAMGAMLYSMLLAAIIGASLMIFKKMKAKTKIAMAPFFFGGTLVSHIVFIITGLLEG